MEGRKASVTKESVACFPQQVHSTKPYSAYTASLERQTFTEVTRVLALPAMVPGAFLPPPVPEVTFPECTCTSDTKSKRKLSEKKKGGKSRYIKFNADIFTYLYALQRARSP